MGRCDRGFLEAQERIQEAKETGATELSLRSLGLRELPTEIANLDQLEELYLSGNQLTEIPEHLSRLQNLTELYLSVNQLTEIPEHLSRLQNLTTLHLSGNQLTEIPEHLSRLQNLTTLDLSGNQLTEIPEHLSRLQNLTTLYLSVNQLTEIPEHLSRLQNLTTLDLSENQLTEIPEHLSRLQNLTTLDLSGNQLTEIPEHLSRLQNLTTLHLSGNQLREIPEHLSRLQNLTELGLSGNQLTEIPEHLSRLQNLTTLHLSVNQLREIPEHLSRLQNLTELGLSGNQLREIPEHLSRLQNLTELGLSGNQLREIPEHLSRLQNLIELYLWDNQLREIPEHLSRLQNLTELGLSGNPIQNPPYEICEQGIEAIREYYRQLRDAGESKLYEAKLLIVGEAGAGKTTLAKKIDNPDYSLTNEPSTEGIDVLQWEFIWMDNIPFRVNIWDFGGQEIYHATHQFFLTKRSLYAIVADNRKEDDNLDYWFRIVELLADDSPVLLVKNEKGDRRRELNEGGLRGQFQQFKESLATNLATNRGLDAVLETVKYHISQLPHVGDTLPTTWVRVRENLENNPNNTISIDTYFEICQEQGFTRQDDKLQLSGYLHDLGICLHFQDDPLLKKTVILKPTWATNAVYQVLDNSQVTENFGHFNRDDVKQIWSQECYRGLEDELLQLMQKFNLCYEISNQPHSFIAPQLLPLEAPHYSWDERENLILRYQYEFMPKGILTRFIVALHDHIAQDSQGQQKVWRTGVVLEKDQTRVEVVEFYQKREIKLRVVGRNKRDVLTIATHELDKIHGSFHNLSYRKLIPCNCPVCKDTQTPHFYEFEKLRERLSHRKHTIECGKPPYNEVNVRDLIDDVGTIDEIENRARGDRRVMPAPELPPLDVPSERSPSFFPNLMDFLQNLSPAKLAAGIVALLLVTTGAITIPQLWQSNSTPEDNSETVENIDLEIYVYDETDNTPLEGVWVRFLIRGGAISGRTDSQGSATLRVPKQADVRLELRKEGFETYTERVNLQVSPERLQSYFLQPE